MIENLSYNEEDIGGENAAMMNPWMYAPRLLFETSYGFGVPNMKLNLTHNMPTLFIALNKNLQDNLSYALEKPNLKKTIRVLFRGLHPELSFLDQWQYEPRWT